VVEEMLLKPIGAATIPARRALGARLFQFSNPQKNLGGWATGHE